MNILIIITGALIVLLADALMIYRVMALQNTKKTVGKVVGFSDQHGNKLTSRKPGARLNIQYSDEFSVIHHLENNHPLLVFLYKPNDSIPVCYNEDRAMVNHAVNLFLFPGISSAVGILIILLGIVR